LARADNASLDERLEQHLARWREGVQRPADVRANAVTISRAERCQGEQIAARVGELLDVPVYERDVVARIAADPELQRILLETLDAAGRAHLEAQLGVMLHEQNFDRSDSLRHVVRTMVALWEHGPCVLVGFGCVHVIPRRHSLAVRLTAPEPARIQRLAAEEGLDVAAARRAIYRADAEREAFHLRFFGVNVHEVVNYDLTLNTGELGPEVCAIITAEAFYRKLRGATRARGRSRATSPRG